MDKKELFGAIESVLYVSGEPLSLFDMQKVFDLTKERLINTLNEMNSEMLSEKRGTLLFITDETVQLITNPAYNEWIVKLLEPPEERTLSNSMLETLSLIAYRQPVTRMDIEAVRGVRCEYAVSQLLKQGFIRELGRKDCVGHPVLFGTTDAFLRRFGLHSLEELPKLPETAEERNEILENIQTSGQEAEDSGLPSDADGGINANKNSVENFEQLEIKDVLDKKSKEGESNGTERSSDCNDNPKNLPKKC